LDLSVGQQAALVGPEAAHANLSLRLRVGEELVITNGLGLALRAEVVMGNREQLQYQVLEMNAATQPRAEIWLYQALAKGDRDELAVQTATELGVTAVVPWQAERSVVRWDAGKFEKGIRRWQAICTEASKQSQRTWFARAQLPTNPGLPEPNSGITLVLDPSASSGFTSANVSGSPRINLIVGPEGGFSASELERAVVLGFTIVRLGSEVLRTSSAGPAAIAAIHTLTGYWS
jgi:16S rRNA (uracil1498-N3)-methyltransferase